jgi:hypothetical protein
MSRGVPRAALAAVLLGAGLLAGQAAEATLVGQSVTVVLGNGTSLHYDDVVSVGALPELKAGDGSEIGAVLLPTESIDIGPTSILLALEEGVPGGGTGYPAGTAYLFSNLVFFETQTAITGVSVSTVNILGLSASDVTFTDTSLRVPIDALTIGEIPGVDVGSIQIDLSFTIIPEPATALLLSLGLLGLAGARARARPPR